jgi:queuine tRNA-ribosyltransferase
MAFDGLALGGFSVGEPPQTMYEMVDWLGPQMPGLKPRYLMGVGRPRDIVRAVRSGMDLFDCVMPTRHARNGQMFTTHGTVNIANTRYRDDPAPVDEGCGCPTCGRFSRAYLSHLYRRKEILYHQLATTHNLHHYLDLMRRIREAVRSQTLGELIKEVDQQDQTDKTDQTMEAPG